MRKPDLVKQLVRSLRSDAGGAGRRSTGPAGRASGSRASAGRAAATKKSAARAVPSRAKAAPANKSAPAKRAAAKKTAATKRTTPARKTAAKKTAAAAKSTAARRTSATARTAPARKAPAKKAPARPAAKRAAPAKRATAKSAAPAKRATAKRAAPAKRATASRSTGTAAGGIRTGRGSGRSVRSSQVIASIADRPERPGRSLITANHEVIQRWARARGAKPATIAGTEREGRAGVLTFNIPGYRESSRIREITWDEWFHTFDLRRLNLIYQEQMRDGRQSNFFRTESPDREDG
ncbi:hypothetical protein [Micromonospora sp. CA-246542]|uniref:hypothetical protein n=1 Tax=Micromonospora sp. CA-246542 TaxID=3239959 RepID=UPI003D8C5561